LSPAALPPAMAVPVVINGGHAAAQALSQADVPAVSESKRYNVRPAPSTRYTPRAPFAVATVTLPVGVDPPVDPADADAAPDRLDPAAPVEVIALEDAADVAAVVELLAAVSDADEPHPAISSPVIATEHASRATAPDP